MALFEKKSVFRKFIDSITMAVYDNPELGPEFLDQLEESLVMADVGIETSAKIIEELNKAINYKYITREREIKKELSRILSDSYEKVYAEYGLGKSFSSRVKPLIISPVMTYTHISGVYSFFTGEANLNTNFPDYVCAFSAAHEMAHQRGFAREDEANFMAFLICTESDNEYVEYAGWLSIYNYLASALRQADYDLFYDAASKLSENATGELIAYNRFFDKYRDSTASDVSDTLNNAYLESQGTEGTKSYGMVVDLAVSYYLTDNDGISE